MTPSKLDTLVTLPDRTSAMAIARACREVGLTFVNESAQWGKADLTLWLLGPYARLLRYTRPESEPFAAAELGAVEARFVDRILTAARREVIETLEVLDQAEEGASFAFHMIASEFVVRCVDAGGGVGWMPTEAPRRLADRVRSLFAADYLSRPTPAAPELARCSVCGSISLDANAAARGLCSAHASPGRSAHAWKARNTLPYLLLGA